MDNFAAALDLFDHAGKRADGFAARHAKISPFTTAALRLVGIGHRMHEWRAIAARDGGMTIFHFFKTFAAVDEHLKLRCPTLREAMAEARYKAAKQLRRQHFRRFEEVRNAIGHDAELWATAERWGKNADAKGERTIPHLTGRTYRTTINGQHVSYDMSAETLANLSHFQREMFASFENIDVTLRGLRVSRDASEME